MVKFAVVALARAWSRTVAWSIRCFPPPLGLNLTLRPRRPALRSARRAALLGLRCSVTTRAARGLAFVRPKTSRAEECGPLATLVTASTLSAPALGTATFSTSVPFGATRT